MEFEDFFEKNCIKKLCIRDKESQYNSIKTEGCEIYLQCAFLNFCEYYSNIGKSILHIAKNRKNLEFVCHFFFSIFHGI